MKKLLLSFLLLCLVGCTFNDSGLRNEKYEFPITPEHEIWESLTQDEKIEKLQIPDDILFNLTTEALLETILDYPLAAHLFAYSTKELGFKKVCEEFNGLDEFRQREDAGTVLGEKLSEMIDDKDRDPWHFMILSIIYQQDEIKSQIEHDKIEKIEKEITHFY